MRGRALGITIIVLGVLLILTPWYIFPVCKVGRYAPPEGVQLGGHGCHDTLKAETALGGLAVIIGFLPVIWPRKKALLAASTAIVLIALLVALFPTVITGMCKVPTMPCNTGTLPALIILSILFGITGVSGIIVFRKIP